MSAASSARIFSTVTKRWFRPMKSPLLPRQPQFRHRRLHQRQQRVPSPPSRHTQKRQRRLCRPPCQALSGTASRSIIPSKRLRLPLSFRRLRRTRRAGDATIRSSKYLKSPSRRPSPANRAASMSNHVVSRPGRRSANRMISSLPAHQMRMRRFGFFGPSLLPPVYCCWLRN